MGDKTLVFERDPDGLLIDPASGSRFDRDGRCVSGTYQGQRLPAVNGVQAEWYGWYATYPETDLFELTP